MTATAPSRRLRAASSQRVEFPGALGDVLAGRLDLPEGRPTAYALFAHCFTCSKDGHAAARISAALTTRGVAVLRFDFTGLGQSGGDFANSNFSSNIADLLAAANWLRSQGNAPSILIGHSLGGAAVLAAAGDVDEVVAVATIGAPCSPEHVSHLIVEAEPGLTSNGQTRVNIGGRVFSIKADFLEDIAAHPQAQRIAALGRPLLVLHSPQDQIVGVDNARAIFDAARHPKSFVALDGADHLLTQQADATFVASLIATWVRRYLPEAPLTLDVPSSRPEASPSPVPAVSGVVVAETDRGRYIHTVRASGHTWTVDEPESSGGQDAGPTPYDMLLSGLGACTSMTMRMYADRKGWDMGPTTVRLQHSRIHARDCDTCETTNGRLDHIEREITLDDSLSAEQRAALLAIADKCPVHRTLTTEVSISTVLADPVLN
ncbi:MAG: bifunctional alpha/beta hydrolase/OsmC family protein, partial [Dermatophilaceae bacterium]